MPPTQVWSHFSAFIVDEKSVISCRYVEPFQSYVLSIDDSLREFEVNLRFSPAKFLWVGEAEEVCYWSGLWKAYKLSCQSLAEQCHG